MFGTIKFCHFKTQANHISCFYIIHNLAMTDIETMKTPTHLKNHRLVSNSFSCMNSNKMFCFALVVQHITHGTRGTDQ